MNQINLTLTLTQASLVLVALRDAADVMNAPQLDAVIDNLQSAYTEAADNEIEDRNFEDGFLTDADADRDALASGGLGMDEDYRPACNDMDE